MAADGTTTGSIVGKTAFMTLRDQRIPWTPRSEIVTDNSETRAEEKLSKRRPRYYATLKARSQRFSDAAGADVTVVGLSRTTGPRMGQ